MWFKNGRIIINEVDLSSDLELLENKLKDFFKTDSRFSKYSINVFVEFDNDCWNEDTLRFWNELNIRIINYDKVIELGGKRKGEKVFATAFLGYSTENHEPQFVFENNSPNFYYVFDLGSIGITNSETWENNRDTVTVEDIVEDILNELEVNEC